MSEEAPCTSESPDWRGCANEQQQAAAAAQESDVKEPEQVSFKRRHWESRSKLKFAHHTNAKRPRKNNNQQHSYFTRSVAKVPYQFNFVVWDDRDGILLYCITTGRFLMIRQKSNRFFGPPKGGQETINDQVSKTTYKEHDFNCALREFLEEVGLYISIEDIAKAIRICTQPDQNFGTRNYTFFLLGCESEMECTIDTNEIESYHWLTLKEIKDCRKASFTTKLFEVIENMNPFPQLHIVKPIPEHQLDPEFVKCLKSTTYSEYPPCANLFANKSVTD